jgi:exosortase
MIPARIAALLVAGGGWHGLWLLAGRADGVGLATTLALAAALGWALVRADHGVRPREVALMLAGSALAAASGIALLQIGAVVAGLYRCASRRPQWPVLALALLAVPMLPTLDMLVAWPLRRAAAMTTAGLLRLNGVGVGIDGVALEWHGRRLLFDGPCSGVRMLWALLVLGSLAAALGRASPLRFAAMLAAAVAVAMAGNALRAASLFYIEAGFVAVPGGPAMHEVVGLAAFAVTAVAAVSLLTRRGVAA